jgi:cytochrome c-type biogenesis protein CcmE
MTTSETRKRTHRLGYPFIIGTIVAVGILLVVNSSFSSGTYSLEIAHVEAHPSKYVGRDVKVVGKVLEGSIETHGLQDRVETHFTIHDGMGKRLRVVLPHNPPDPFKEGRQVIVEGVFEASAKGSKGSSGYVLCHKLTVKCPSKYQEEGEGDTGYSDEYYRKKYGNAQGSGTP